MIFMPTSFSKGSVFKKFSVHTKPQSRCFQIPPLKERFERPRCRDGLVWAEGLTVEIWLRFFFNFSGAVWTVPYKRGHGLVKHSRDSKKIDSKMEKHDRDNNQP